MTIQELLQTLNKDAVNFISCIQSEYDNIGRYAENTIYFVQDTRAIYKGSVLYCKLSEIGSLTNLDTSNKQSLVAAINEVNQKAINQGGNGTINDSTISPFAGFMAEAEMNQIVLENTDSNDGAVYCDFYGNGFYYKVGSMFHAFWNYGYEYNSGISSGGYNKAKEGKIFSYNDKHYIVYNGTLQDISILDDTGNGNTAGKVKLSDSISGSTYDSNRGVASTPKAVADLGISLRNYVNSQINNKIQLVSQLPVPPVDGILYLIQEVPLSKPTEE